MNTSLLLGTGLMAALCLNAPSANAITLKGKMPDNYTLVTVSEDGKAATASGTLNLASSGGNLRLYAIDEHGSLGGPVILAVKRGNQYYTFKQATKKRKCDSSKASLVLGIAAGTSGAKLNLGTIAVDAANGIAYAGKLLNKKFLDKQGTTALANAGSCLPEGTGNTLGLKLSSAGAAPVLAAAPSAAEESDSPGKDKDKDGLVDALDVDKDGDGILNPYDSDSASSPSDGTSSFRVFSNLKLEIESSLNQYVRSLTAADLDKAIANASLAIQVAGSESDTVELNCFGLSYCSKGGTGTVGEGGGGKAFPDDFDSDGDGFGTITRGSTNDFQLRPNAFSTSAIKGGDTFVEIVTDSSGAVREIPGMLNFIFSTTPAIASITMGSETKEISYPPSEGTMNNPFVAPADWDGKLTLTAYRPQRVGIKAAGEGDFVDIGRSTITIDLPNAPCTNTPGSGCVSGRGPGNCKPETYSNLSGDLSMPSGTGPGGDGIQDNRGDKDTDTANPTANQVSFTVDLEQCLGDINWNSGQVLAVDLQFRNSAGDNAAQKFRIKKP